MLMNEKVKVDFFKHTMKWYISYTIEWVKNHKDEDPLDIFENSIDLAFVGLKGMFAVCINNPSGVPLMIKVN